MSQWYKCHCNVQLNECVGKLILNKLKFSSAVLQTVDFSEDTFFRSTIFCALLSLHQLLFRRLVPCVNRELYLGPTECPQLHVFFFKKERKSRPPSPTLCKFRRMSTENDTTPSQAVAHAHLASDLHHRPPMPLPCNARMYPIQHDSLQWPLTPSPSQCPFLISRSCVLLTRIPPASNRNKKWK